MYLEHFSLREAPFSITPDTAFFYPHEAAQAAFNTLLIALRSGEGFLKVVGEVGCGKTVLCRQLLRVLQDECVTAYIPNPDISPDDLLMALASELEVTLTRPLRRHQVMLDLRNCLLEHAKAGRPVVVFVDEAQAISFRTVERLRLISNLETEKRKLLQLVLLGQPELDEKLSQPGIRQLLQRITFSEYLGPMTPAQVPGYLAHRLTRAAVDENTDVDLFEPAAAQALARYSTGVPRLVNIVANKCLMLAYGENVHRVSVDHVRQAAFDTPGVRKSSSWWTRMLPWSADKRDEIRAPSVAQACAGGTS
ncbi:MAG: AAA family ATPase [Hylemonella sp.]|nr:AAA family ATPase [Hylemonella sp.]MDH5708357.1 AAA family ATPase [Hylemonella sp.]